MTVFVNLFDIIAVCIVGTLILLYGLIVLIEKWQHRRDRSR